MVGRWKEYWEGRRKKQEVLMVVSNNLHLSVAKYMHINLLYMANWSSIKFNDSDEGMQWYNCINSDDKQIKGRYYNMFFCSKCGGYHVLYIIHAFQSKVNEK